MCIRDRLIGYLGKDPELKQLDGGNALSRVSLATKEVYKNKKGEKVEDTQWHNLIGWGKTAELMDTLLKKGKHIVVDGRIAYNTYEDKDGVKRTATQIVVAGFELMG